MVLPKTDPLWPELAGDPEAQAEAVLLAELRRVFDPMERSNPGKVIPQPGACVEVAAPRRQAPL